MSGHIVERVALLNYVLNLCQDPRDYVNPRDPPMPRVLCRLLRTAAEVSADDRGIGALRAWLRGDLSRIGSLVIPEVPAPRGVNFEELRNYGERMETAVREHAVYGALDERLGNPRWCYMVWADNDQILCLGRESLLALATLQLRGNLSALIFGRAPYWRSWTRDSKGRMTEDVANDGFVDTDEFDAAADNIATAHAGWRTWRQRC